MLVWSCRFPVPLEVWEGLHFVIVAFPGLFSYIYFLFFFVSFHTDYHNIIYHVWANSQVLLSKITLGYQSFVYKTFLRLETLSLLCTNMNILTNFYMHVGQGPFCQVKYKIFIYIRGQALSYIIIISSSSSSSSSISIIYK